jgi:hypothetical protein
MSDKFESPAKASESQVVDVLANRMSQHLPCTVASIADALRKAMSTDIEEISIRMTPTAEAEAVAKLKAEKKPE